MDPWDVPVQHDHGEHQLVQSLLVGEVPPKGLAVQGCGLFWLRRCVVVIRTICISLFLLTLGLAMLSPPNLRHRVHQAIDLLEVRGDLHEHKSLRKPRHHTGATELHRVHELKTQRPREREGLPQKVANLGEVQQVTLQGDAQLCRRPTDAPRRNEEGEPLARLFVEEVHAEFQEILLVDELLYGGSLWKDERLILHAGASTPVSSLLAKVPGLVWVLMAHVRSHRLPRQGVRAEVERCLILVVPHEQTCLCLQQRDDDLATAHEDSDVESSPSAAVPRVEAHIRLDQLCHDPHRTRATGRMQGRGAVRIACLYVRTQQQDPSDGHEVGASREEQQLTLQVAEPFQSLLEDGASRVRRSSEEVIRFLHERGSEGGGQRTAMLDLLGQGTRTSTRNFTCRTVLTPRAHIAHRMAKPFTDLMWNPLVSSQRFLYLSRALSPSTSAAVP